MSATLQILYLPALLNASFGTASNTLRSNLYAALNQDLTGRIGLRTDKDFCRKIGFNDCHRKQCVNLAQLDLTKIDVFVIDILTEWVLAGFLTISHSRSKVFSLITGLKIKHDSTSYCHDGLLECIAKTSSAEDILFWFSHYEARASKCFNRDICAVICNRYVAFRNSYKLSLSDTKAILSQLSKQFGINPDLKALDSSLIHIEREFFELIDLFIEIYKSSGIWHQRRIISGTIICHVFNANNLLQHFRNNLICNMVSRGFILTDAAACRILLSLIEATRLDIEVVLTLHRHHDINNICYVVLEILRHFQIIYTRVHPSRQENFLLLLVSFMLPDNIVPVVKHNVKLYGVQYHPVIKCIIKDIQAILFLRIKLACMIDSLNYILRRIQEKN